MTSPISTEDLEGMIPRGYVLSAPSSGVYAAIDNNSSRITLGPGVHRLACTWEGPQTVGINVARDEVGTRRFAEFAGGGDAYSPQKSASIPQPSCSSTSAQATSSSDYAVPQRCTQCPANLGGGQA